ncbi:MAG: hypothetical protein BAA01_03800 [Bacillus thermozeamaize]|jgi:predicted transcriptional regulator|uniref:CBS domain-containing protein n=1 Tax=Bacillus thermozeamaize TaxID=230954 RepID=A0A1Y3PNN2_9BACI|nr:MAG: hypothetical protein BAA01_03800 [Bacillus thermozeamaize]
MTTKHHQILRYIEGLEVGTKISVRQIAKDLDVSEGTAYRAIKDAEAKGLVSTIERVGTIRIEKKVKENIERLTFAEVVNIVDGHVLGGRGGLHKTLQRMVIGAMKLEDMMKYVDPGSLLIVGNRDRAHLLAMEAGSAVLITGGFDAREEVKQLADEKQLPLISSAYDTFTVASLINRAIYDRLIKKDIVMVEDVLAPREKVLVLTDKQTVLDWQKLVENTRHSRFPVIDGEGKIIGVVTSKDVLGMAPETPITEVMTRNPITTTPYTSIAAVAHRMVWEGIEMIPVVDEERRLISVISRQDVLKAMQLHQKQPQVGETIEDIVRSALQEFRDERGVRYRLVVTPQMTNPLGMLSNGVMTTLLEETSIRSLRRHRKGEMIVENLTIYFMKPIPLESHIEVRPSMLEVGRRFGKVDLEVTMQGQLMGKALLTAQVWER